MLHECYIYNIFVKRYINVIFMRTKDKRNFLANLDWFDINFICNFLYEKNKIKEFLNKQVFSISDESISSRVLNHWHEIGIVTDNRPDKKGWRKFSFAEVIWLSIAVQLRKFGLDLRRIKEVKDYLDSFNSEDNQSKCPLLDFYIAYAKASKKPVKLLAFDTGESFLARQIDIDFANQIGLIKDDYISIDINKLISVRFKNDEDETDYLNYSFTEIEKEVHKAIYYEDVKSISIHVNGGKEYLIKKEHIVDSKQEIKNLLKKAGTHFEETSVHTGKKVFHKLVEKKKMQK